MSDLAAQCAATCALLVRVSEGLAVESATVARALVQMLRWQDELDEAITLLRLLDLSQPQTTLPPVVPVGHQEEPHE